jgi:hypothetical protein
MVNCLKRLGIFVASILMTAFATDLGVAVPGFAHHHDYALEAMEFQSFQPDSSI